MLFNDSHDKKRPITTLSNDHDAVVTGVSFWTCALAETQALLDCERCHVAVLVYSL